MPSPRNMLQNLGRQGCGGRPLMLPHRVLVRLFPPGAHYKPSRLTERGSRDAPTLGLKRRGLATKNEWRGMRVIFGPILDMEPWRKERIMLSCNHPIHHSSLECGLLRCAFFGRKSTLRPAHTRFQALARTLYDGRVGWRLKPCNDLVRQFRRMQIASGEAWRLIGRRTHQMSPSHCPCHPTG